MRTCSLFFSSEKMAGKRSRLRTKRAAFLLRIFFSPIFPPLLSLSLPLSSSASFLSGWRFFVVVVVLANVSRMKRVLLSFYSMLFRGLCLRREKMREKDRVLLSSSSSSSSFFLLLICECVSGWSWGWKNEISRTHTPASPSTDCSLLVMSKH